MKHEQVLLDSDIVLDYLLERRELNPLWETLPQYLIQHGIPYCLAAHQLVIIQSVYERESVQKSFLAHPEPARHGTGSSARPSRSKPRRRSTGTIPWRVTIWRIT